MADIYPAVTRTCMKCGGEYTTERPEVLVGDEACGYWKPRLSAHRECIHADPTPAAPDPQPRVCSNCGAMLGPKETGHFVPPSVGESGFYYCRADAPDQAEGPQPMPERTRARIEQLASDAARRAEIDHLLQCPLRYGEPCNDKVHAPKTREIL